MFNPGASAFTINAASHSSFDGVLLISGVGITNNSGITQNFTISDDYLAEVQSTLRFTGSASAGKLTVFTVLGRPYRTNSYFGTLPFEDHSTADAARVVVVDPGVLDISSHNAPGVTIGSPEGDGLVSLGANNLTVGSNNLSTIFSGKIRGAGSLTKMGTGKLTLAGSNRYAGGTVVDQGVLLVNNKRTSRTGTRAVQANAGTLGEKGTIAAAVTVGTGSASGAFLSPGVGAASHHTLTIQNTLTFNSDGTYRCGFNSSTGQADKVLANRIIIDSSAQFSFEDSNASELPVGTVFTVIDNTAAIPISGTFANLADHSTFTVGSNSFQADYEGGDGNDLTLTVVAP